MPGGAPPVANERQGLLAFLAQQRLVLRLSAYGLTDEQARATPSASALSVGGLIKHVSAVEEHWIDVVLQCQAPFDPGADWSANFRLLPEETVAGVLDRYEQAARRTSEVIDGIADLGQPVPVPRDTPWFPADVEAWSVRWVLLHLITETARHAGHADIVRESLDGATAFPLMAAAEGWPDSPWIKPWSPPA
jgi:uncharacterized damage-inducible protein DinB